MKGKFIQTRDRCLYNKGSNVGINSSNFPFLYRFWTGFVGALIGTSIVSTSYIYIYINGHRRQVEVEELASEVMASWGGGIDSACSAALLSGTFLPTPSRDLIIQQINSHPGRTVTLPSA